MIYAHCVKVHRQTKKGKYEESDPTNASANTPQMCRLTHY